MGEIRKAHKILLGKPEEDTPLGIPKLTGKIILKCILKKEDIKLINTLCG
jgi:hypothetical protein